MGPGKSWLQNRAGIQARQDIVYFDHPNPPLAHETFLRDTGRPAGRPYRVQCGRDVLPRTGVQLLVIEHQ